MNLPLIFQGSPKLTMGVELEIQLINLKNFNLAMEASDFLRRLEETKIPGEIKPEITQSMIEINSSVHENFTSLQSELCVIRDILSIEAKKTHVGLCGGGAHPFQKWKNQRIFPTERYTNLSDQYGFLAKQFTVFGQHIHIGCRDGEETLYLCHALVPYIPHFIALAASSPFHQSVDTAFDCSRLTIVSAFPLSGTPPWIFSWQAFEDYFDKMVNLGIVKSMKDFYWDIRPKPEYGTVELRICDTPLTVEVAAEIAAYAQSLVCYLRAQKDSLDNDIYLTYFVNRFRAARYGLDARLVDPVKKSEISIAEDILSTCKQLMPYAEKLGSESALKKICLYARARSNGATSMRKFYDEFNALSDVVREQALLWMGED
jgi:carboxylate-amine ligase